MIQDLNTRLRQGWALFMRYRILRLLIFLSVVLMSIINLVNGSYSKPPTGFAPAINCVAPLVGLAAFAVSVVLQAGLISATDQALQGNTLTLRGAWQAGVRRWWTLFVLELLLIFLPIIVGLIILLLILPQTTAVAIATPCAVILSVVALLSQCVLVLTTDTPRQAIRRTLDLVRSNLHLVVLMNIVFVVIGLLISILADLTAGRIHAVVPSIEPSSAKRLLNSAITVILVAWEVAVWAAFYREVNPALPNSRLTPGLADYPTS